MSTADILAAARGGGTAPAKPAAKDAKKDAPPAPKEKKADAGSMSVADILAAARGGGTAPAKPAAKDAKKDAPPAPKEKKADAGSMSVADVLAAARGEKKQGPDRGAAANAGEVATPQPAEQPKAKAQKSLPKNQGLPADVPGIIAYCRKTDSKK